MEMRVFGGTGISVGVGVGVSVGGTGVSVGVLVTGSDLAPAAFGVVVSGLVAADGCAVSDGFCSAAGLAVDFAGVFDFAADDAREVDVCFGVLLPLPGVFAFATLKTLPILAAHKPFF